MQAEDALGRDRLGARAPRRRDSHRASRSAQGRCSGRRTLLDEYDAVFLGLGLGADSDASASRARTGRASSARRPDRADQARRSSAPTPRRRRRARSSIGGGNTAIDVAHELRAPRRRRRHHGLPPRREDDARLRARARGARKDGRPPAGERGAAVARDAARQARRRSSSPTADGKPSAAPSEELACDLIVVAIGQRAARPRGASSPASRSTPRAASSSTRPRTAPATPRCTAAATASNGGKEVVNAVAEASDAVRACIELRRCAGATRAVMADLSSTSAGIKCPNPFWLASAPPTNTGDQVMRAFDAGWGGAVWKTLGNPIVNVSSRFGGIDYGNTPDDGAQQHRAHHRPPARGEPPRDPRGEEALSRSTRSSPR